MVFTRLRNMGNYITRFPGVERPLPTWNEVYSFKVLLDSGYILSEMLVFIYGL